ncbi:MAG: CDP-archaeol synthase [Candidatus Wildermuthbacteria bacterium]|nr:CDP-archaeol synthase [Candidatus Wildermuthbacteria bacterium]
MEFLVACSYFILPACAANVVPVLAKRFNIFPSLALPMDCGVKVGGEPLLGSHKTLRGFVLGTMAAVIVTMGQNILDRFTPLSVPELVDYAQANWLVLGFLLGFGSLIGDAMGSFVKRRARKKPGKPFPVLDQVGMAIMAIIMVMGVYPLSMDAIVAIIVLTFFWHMGASRTAYLFGIRQEKW